MTLIHFSPYKEKLNHEDPNLDVSNLPLLEYTFLHLNLDVPGLPQMKCICWHPNLDVSCLPKLEYIKFSLYREKLNYKDLPIGCYRSFYVVTIEGILVYDDE